MTYVYDDVTYVYDDVTYVSQRHRNADERRRYQNVLSHDRMCSLPTECVLFPIECVLLLQNVFTDCRMCSLGMKIQVTFDVQTTHARPYRYVFSTECVLYRMCSL